MIREVNPADAAQIIEIYNYYILNTTVTFEEEAVTAAEMAGRIAEITEKFPWLVYESEGKIIGYAYASAWKSRCAYKYSVETTVYLQHGLSGKGYGSELYAELLVRLQQSGLHGIIGGVALPNDGCIALHQKFGFEKVAQFREVGFKFNKWIDVTYWEKILD
jgi:L-amino acid N-acyltransferase YncA